MCRCADPDGLDAFAFQGGECMHICQTRSSEATLQIALLWLERWKRPNEGLECEMSPDVDGTPHSGTRDGAWPLPSASFVCQ